MFAQVPVLPVVVPAAASALALMVWRLSRRGLLSWPRAAVALALSVYVAGVLANTLFPIYLDKPPRSGPWQAYIDLTPLTGYEVADAAMNVCVFVPLGLLLGLVLPRWTWWRVLAAATVFSLAIETSQLLAALFLGGGHVADVNDFLFNVVGAGCGCVLLSTLSSLPRAVRPVDRFRWV